MDTKKLIRILKVFKNSNAFFSSYEIITFIRNSIVFSRNEYARYIGLLNRLAEKEIINKFSVQYLLKEKLIDPSKKYDCKHMYTLGILGIELMKIFFPNEPINYNKKLIVVPFCEAYMKFNDLLCNGNKYKYRKETFMSLLNKDYLLRFGRYFYVIVAEDIENLKTFLPNYPYISFDDSIFLLLKTKLNQNLKLIIYKKIFKNDDSKLVSTFDFCKNFINICKEVNNEKIIKSLERKKGVVNG